MPVSDFEELKAAAGALLDMGAGNVILTLGAQGALYACENELLLAPAFPVEAVDTTASGDAFVGGFAAALSEGKSMQEAVNWGNAAGALAVTKLGAQPSLPGRVEVVGLLGEDN
jgi:ribokinase